ncbi:MAG: tyrosine-protein phosphatase [Ruminococcaceae bacterium]|nr:tyrosine-protein phosphatase [Oscillospiraceae bacterium]
MKNGLIQENGKWIYYKDGEPYHAGVIQHGDDIYYISSHGRPVTGQHVVHTSMANGILKRGIYTFDEDGRLIKDSYRPPEKRKKRSRQKSKVRLNTNQLSVICGIVLIIAFLLVVIWTASSGDAPLAPQPPTQTEPTSPSTPSVVMPVFEEEVLLCSTFAMELYNGEADLAQAFQSGNPYRPFAFEYRLAHTSGILRVSETAEMTDYREFVLDKDKTVLLIDNLKTGTTYYYRATADGEDYTGSFCTAQTPRFVSVPSLKNVRDIGGYRTESGKTVKQGLIIRGPEADGLVNPDYFIPKNDIPAVQETFGFVYEMDLRASDIYAGTYHSRFGNDVKHRFYAASSYAGIFRPENLAAIKAVFSDLANPANYPMYLHCTWGADRTGTIVFLLQGVLGVSEKDMTLEYQLTEFATSGFSQKENLDKLIWGLESYEGDTLQEKIVHYLTETVGVTPQEIASIRRILLE